MKLNPFKRKKRKRNYINEEYCEVLKALSQWQAEHPGQKYPDNMSRKLRDVAKRYAAHIQGKGK